MKKITQHVFSKFISIFIMAGFIFSVLFGQGTHVHSIFDHLFEHGDIHIYVHSHSHSANHEHEESEFDFEEPHNHPISTLSLKSVRVQYNKKKVSQQTQSYISIIPADVRIIEDGLIPALIDLPPPDSVFTQLHSSSFFLRAPPLR